MHSIGHNCAHAVPAYCAVAFRHSTAATHFGVAANAQQAAAPGDQGMPGAGGEIMGALLLSWLKGGWLRRLQAAGADSFPRPGVQMQGPHIPKIASPYWPTRTHRPQLEHHLMPAALRKCWQVCCRSVRSSSSGSNAGGLDGTEYSTGWAVQQWAMYALQRQCAA